MEKENGTLRTEKDLEIAKLKYELALTKELKMGAESSKLIFEQQISQADRVIEGLEKILVELFDEKPKLSAADFPCLDYYANRVTFNDGKNMYTITEDFKQIIRSARAAEEIIDENVEVVECKSTDIKKGDCFSLIFEDNSSMAGYRFCTKTDGMVVYFDYGKNEYIAQGDMVIRSEGEFTYVKFILRNK